MSWRGKARPQPESSSTLPAKLVAAGFRTGTTFATGCWGRTVIGTAGVTGDLGMCLRAVTRRWWWTGAATGTCPTAVSGAPGSARTRVITEGHVRSHTQLGQWRRRSPGQRSPLFPSQRRRVVCARWIQNSAQRTPVGLKWAALRVATPKPSSRPCAANKESSQLSTWPDCFSLPSSCFQRVRTASFTGRMSG